MSDLGFWVRLVRGGVHIETPVVVYGGIHG